MLRSFALLAVVVIVGCSSSDPNQAPEPEQTETVSQALTQCGAVAALGACSLSQAGKIAACTAKYGAACNIAGPTACSRQINASWACYRP